MNLSQRQVTELPRDLLWNETHVVPLRDAADRDSCAGDAGPSAADVGTLRDQAADFGDGCHRFKYSAHYLPDKWLLKEVGKSLGCDLPVVWVLQFLPHPSDLARYPGDGSGPHESHLESCGFTELV